MKRINYDVFNANLSVEKLPLKMFELEKIAYLILNIGFLNLKFLGHFVVKIVFSLIFKISNKFIIVSS